MSARDGFLSTTSRNHSMNFGAAGFQENGALDNSNDQKYLSEWQQKLTESFFDKSIR